MQRINLIHYLGVVFRFVFRYSGLAFLWNKFTYHGPESRHEPSGPVWLIGIYVTVFGIANSQFSSTVQEIEKLLSYSQPITRQDMIRTNFFTFQCEDRHYLKRYFIEVPIEPIFSSPSSVVRSFFGVKTVVRRTEASAAWKWVEYYLRELSRSEEPKRDLYSSSEYEQCQNVAKRYLEQDFPTTADGIWGVIECAQMYIHSMCGR